MMLIAIIAIVNLVKTASTITTINNGTANSCKNIIDASKDNNNRINFGSLNKIAKTHLYKQSWERAVFANARMQLTEALYFYGYTAIAAAACVE